MEDSDGYSDKEGSTDSGQPSRRGPSKKVAVSKKDLQEIMPQDVISLIGTLLLMISQLLRGPYLYQRSHYTPYYYLSLRSRCCR